METNRNNIGLVAWGLKLGYQVFFHIGNIRVDVPPVSSAIKDIRGVVNFSQPGQSFYSLEFTEYHRIYTVYYTIYDWANRDGAYYALSLLVPHGLSCESGKLLKLLDELTAAYKANYLDLATNQIRRQQENPAVFLDILNRYVFSQATNYAFGGVNVNPSGGLSHVIYSEKELLGHYFDDSYRNEFRSFKEIFFIPETSIKHGTLRMDPSSIALPFTPIVERFKIDLVFLDRNSQQLRDIDYRVFVNGVQIPSTNGKIIGICKEDSIRVVGESNIYEGFDQTTFLSQLRLNPATQAFRWPIMLVSKQFPAVITLINQYNYPVPNALVSIDGYQYKSDKNGRVISRSQYEPGAKIHVTAGQKGFIDFNSTIVLSQLSPNGNLSGDAIQLLPYRGGFDISDHSSKEKKMRLFMIGLIILLASVIALLSFELFIKEAPKNEEKNPPNTPNLTQTESAPKDQDSIFLKEPFILGDSVYRSEIKEILVKTISDSSGWKYQRASIILEILAKVPKNPTDQQLKESGILKFYHEKIEKTDKLDSSQNSQLLKILGVVK